MFFNTVNRIRIVTKDKIGPEIKFKMPFLVVFLLFIICLFLSKKVGRKNEYMYLGKKVCMCPYLVLIFFLIKGFMSDIKSSHLKRY